MSCRTVLRNALLSLSLGLATVLVFRPATPAPAAEISAELQKAVQEGASFERSRKWIDAIDYYEKSAKRHPEASELTYGLRRSRIYLGIERRYTDPSFTRALPGLSKYQAVQVFDEILDRVQQLYVEPIALTTFATHGSESLWFAVTDERFQQNNIPVRNRGNVGQFRQILKSEYWNKPLSSRAECTQMLNEICDHAERVLGLHAGPVIMEFVFGGCNALDDYSGYLTPGRMKDLTGNINGQFVGLGVEMKAEPGKGLLLVHVLPESPADAGGIRSGEHIVSVDGKSVIESTTDEAAGLLQGTEGSRVTLEIQGKVRKTPRTVVLVRRPVVIKSIPVARIIDQSNGIGYIQMTGFQKSTVDELDAALNKLRGQNMRALIWDVRGNPGGLLPVAVQVSDRFISDGVLVSTKGRVSDQNHTYPAYQAGTWKLPLVLLIDGDSASASEIVAGCIRDHHRGTIVGRKSYGKWSVQTIYEVAGDAGLRLTTAKFYSPMGLTHGKVGVHPDIEVPLDDSAKDESRYKNADNLGTDRDVLKGIEVLQEKLASR